MRVFRAHSRILLWRSEVIWLCEGKRAYVAQWYDTCPDRRGPTEKTFFFFSESQPLQRFQKKFQNLNVLQKYKT